MAGNMRDIPFIECIASRALVLQRPDGSKVPVTLEIGRPMPVPQYKIPSACPFRVTGLDGEEKLYAVGADSVQALQLAMDGIAAWLVATAARYGGKFADPNGAATLAEQTAAVRK